LYKPCRPYLPRYFGACINIPSDWIAVADYVQTFSGEISEANVYWSALNPTNETVNNDNAQQSTSPTLIRKFRNVVSASKARNTTKSLPAILRKVMAAKFPDFDEYQLAKYNKNKKAKKVFKDKVGCKCLVMILSISK
jgi:telomerase protein component 1